jgi:hypothetical protein
MSHEIDLSIFSSGLLGRVLNVIRSYQTFWARIHEKKASSNREVKHRSRDILH